MTDSSEDTAPVLGPLDEKLLQRCPELKSPEFLSLKKEQKMFVYLLTRNEKESTHVELKTSMLSDDLDFRLLRSACAMYNGLQPDMREPSLTDLGQTSSYIVFGVAEEQRKSSEYSRTFHPLSSYKGEEEIQDLFRFSTMPFVQVYWHLVHFKESHIEPLGHIPKGGYGLLEVSSGTEGPAYFRLKSKRKSQRVDATTNQLYTRCDAQNIPEKDWDSSLREKVFALFQRHYDIKGLMDVRDRLEEADRAFRVLVLTPPTGVQDPSDKETLFRALGRGKWSIVFDFDEYGRKEGCHADLIEKEMIKQGRNYCLKAGNELRAKFAPNELEQCQRGDITLYIQAAGCSSRGISKLTNEAELEKRLRSNVLEPVFEHNLSPKPVLCFSLFLSATSEAFVSSRVRPDVIPSLLKEAYESESGSANEFESLTVCINSHVKSQLPDAGKSHDDLYVVPANQLSCTIESVYPLENQKFEYELPGISGTCTLSRQEIASLKPHLRLYHLKAGQRGYLSLTKQGRREKSVELMREFLAGNELTKEMLYINMQLEYENRRVYVKRRQVKELMQKVQTTLEYYKKCFFTKYDPDERQIIRFPYEPASGATTIARTVVWELRESYPCVEVKDVKKFSEVGQGICSMCKKAELPVLILLDSHISDYVKVRSSINELNMFQPAPKFVVLFVERVNPVSSQQANNLSVLTAKLSDEEADAFEKIYNEAGGDVALEKLAKKVEEETERTPFLFGVWYFRNDYRKIDKYVDLLLKEISPDKKKLLYFSSLAQLFIHAPLDLAIAAGCLGLSPAQSDPSKVLSALGMQRHLLTVRKQRRIFGFAPVLVVGKKILERLFSAEDSDSCDMQANQILAFVRDLCDMYKKGDNQMGPCLRKLIQELITCHKRTLDTKRRFSDFVFQMHCSMPEKVEEQFLQLAQSFTEKKSHILIHCARLFAYEHQDYSKSLELVSKALESDPERVFWATDCTDDVILGLSAHLINCRLNSDPNLSFEDLLRLSLQSIVLCREAQKTTRLNRLTGKHEYRAQPFFHEIQAQRILLNKFFSDKCQSEYTEYFKQLNADENDIVKEAHDKILDNVFRLERMQEENKLEQGTFTAKEAGQLDEIKMEFARRYYAHGQPISNNKLLPPLYSDVPFGWVAVEFFVMCESKPLSREAADTDFEVDDFTSSDHEFSPLDSCDRACDTQYLSRDWQKSLFDILSDCKSKLAKNYLEMCVLLSFLNPPEALEKALAVSDEWCRKFDDFQAHFIHGAFQLVKALSCATSDKETSRRLLRVGMSSLEKCDSGTILQSGTETKRLSGSQRPRIFFLREGKLLGFLPRNKSHDDQKSLMWRNGARKFTGFLEEENCLVCNELDGRRLHVPPWSVSENLRKKKRNVSFALAVAYSGLTPVDIQAS